MDLSIVIPLYDESRSVEPLARAIVRSLASTKFDYEVVLVDDGSSDDTFERARAVSEEDDRFKILKLRKNFGQTAALYAGFEYANGDIIVTMDGDLQNDPDDIGRLIDKMNEGYDVVIGWREDRQDRLLDRKLPSRAANWLIRRVTGAAVRDNGCALRAYRADVIKKFPLYSEMHRLLPTILALAGVRMAQIEVKHHSRKYGSSKYGLARVYKVLFDLVALKMVLTSARLPLFGFGSSAVVAGVLGTATVVAGAFRFWLYPGTSLIVYLGVSLLWWTLGISLLLFGVLCLLIYNKASFRIEDLLERRKL